MTKEKGPSGLSEQKAQEFAGQIFEAGLGALNILSIALGRQLGYYTALAGAGRGLNAIELARKTATNQRYTREWLEQQAVNGYVEVAVTSDDPDARKYRLPEHARCALLDEDDLNYIAPLADMAVAAIANIPALATAFRNGTGVSWARFGRRMREAQAAMNRPMFMRLFGGYLRSAPQVHARLKGKKDARVADIACGAGWSSIAVAQAFPQAHVDGFDIDQPSITLARKNARAAGVASRVTFHCADASGMERSGEYDLVMICEALHDFARPVEALATMKALAGSKGVVLVMDERVGDQFTAPSGPVERIMYGYSISICLPDAMSQRPTAATGTVMRASTLERYAREAGFTAVDVLPIDNDFFRFYQLRQ